MLLSLYMPITHPWSFALHVSLTSFFRSPLSQSNPYSLFLSLSSIPFSQSITHSDSLCNMPSSKLSSTLLDLQPFPSSKWLTSVITLQPEWETQRWGREEGWQTEAWHERRGNAGLIIHTYCSKKRVSERERDTGREIERERQNERDRLTQMGRYSSGSSALWEPKLCHPRAMGVRELHR